MTMTSVQKKNGNLATIQVDIDGLWTTLEYYGHQEKCWPDPFFEKAIPRYLDLFQKYNIKATFFLIGKDCDVPEKAAIIKRIQDEGHEIANHTYSHPFGFRSLSAEQQLQEIVKGEEAIQRITGKSPRGFKAPGYDIDHHIIATLNERGYCYDSSMMPTFVYPFIMRMNNLFSGGIRRTHGPKWYWAFAPNKPYVPSTTQEWKNGKGWKNGKSSEKNFSRQNLLEVPSSVIPFFRLPFHATFALRLGSHYFKAAYALAQKRNAPLVYEFHAADLADTVTDDRLSHLKNYPLEKRLRLVEEIIHRISRDYSTLTTQDLVKELLKK